MPFFSSFSGANSFGRKTLPAVAAQLQRSVANATPNFTVGRFITDTGQLMHQIFDFQIEDSGTRLFIADDNGGISQYTIDTPYMLHTVDRSSFSRHNFGETVDIGTGPQTLTTISSFCFKPDGTKLFTLGIGSAFVILEYTLSTAFDLSSATRTHYFQISAIAPKELKFSSDGLLLYYTEGVNSIRQITLTNAWDTSTLSEFPPTTGNTLPFLESFDLSSDGTKTLSAYSHPTLSPDEYDFKYLVEGTLSTAYDFSTWSITAVSSFGSGIRWDGSPGTGGRYYEHMSFKMPDDQPYFYVADMDQAMIYQYTAAGNFAADNPDPVHTSSGEIIPQTRTLQTEAVDESVEQQMYIDPTGTHIFIGNMKRINSDVVLGGQNYAHYTMSTPWDLSTATDVSTTTTLTNGEYLGIFFKPDGTKFYTLDTASGSGGLVEWDTTNGTPWDISNPTESQRINDSILATEAHVFFNSTGTKLWIGNDLYTLSTPWDIGTATDQGNDSRFSGSLGYWISDDEKFFYNIGHTSTSIAEDTTVTIREIDIDKGTNIAYGSENDSIFRNTTSRPLSISFKPDREKMFILDRTGVITSYTLGEA